MCVKDIRFSKILKCILLFLFINLIFSSSCFAYSWVETSNGASSEKILNYVTEKAWGYSDIWEDSTLWGSGYYDKISDSIDYYLNANYYALILNSTKTQIYLEISTSGIDNLDSYGSAGVKARRLANQNYIMISKSTNGKLSVSQSPNPYALNSTNQEFTFSNITYAFLYNGSYYQAGDGTYNSSDIITLPTFTPNYDHIINITNVSDNVYNFNQYLGGVPDVTTFGTFSEEFTDFIVDIYLNKQWSTSQGSSLTRSTFYNSTFTTKDLKLDNYKLYLNDRFLEYNTLYTLIIYYYKDYNSFSTGQPTGYDYKYFYITTPTSAIVTGETINYSGNSNFIPPNVDNSINNINDNSEVNSQMSEFLSGDLAAKMGYDTSEFETGSNAQYWNFIWTFWENCYNTLISSQNVAINFTIHGSTFTFYSSDFTTPNTPLKTFCTTFLVVGFFFLMYQQIVAFIHELEEGDLRVLHESDADCYFFDL